MFTAPPHSLHQDFKQRNKRRHALSQVAERSRGCCPSTQTSTRCIRDRQVLYMLPPPPPPPINRVGRMDTLSNSSSFPNTEIWRTLEGKFTSSIPSCLFPSGFWTFLEGRAPQTAVCIRAIWTSCSSADSDSAGLGWGLRCCICNSPPVGPILLVPRPTLGIRNLNTC